jgi:hypothetical protein
MSRTPELVQLVRQTLSMDVEEEVDVSYPNNMLAMTTLKFG